MANSIFMMLMNLCFMQLNMKTHKPYNACECTPFDFGLFYVLMLRFLTVSVKLMHHLTKVEASSGEGYF